LPWACPQPHMPAMRDASKPVPRYTGLRLPRWRCVPAHVALPDRKALELVETVPARLDPGAVSHHEAFRYGADLFNAGYFWEAHEIWEPVWLALPPNSCARFACQAVIQAANAFLKLAGGRPNAFLRIASDVRRYAREAQAQGAIINGIDMADWARAFDAFAASVGPDAERSFTFEPSEMDGFPYVTLLE